VVLVLLLLFIVRPLLKSLSGPMKAALTQPPPLANPQGAMVGASSRPVGTIAYEQQIAQARGLVSRDPVRVAQVVKDWVENDA
jgi:flagellar biosynthesis/type III secretory pathway M-ring protein FliF/YscJ